MGSVQQEERGKGLESAGQAWALGVWKSMGDPEARAVPGKEEPWAQQWKNTEGAGEGDGLEKGLQPEEGASHVKGRGTAISKVRP